MPQTIQQFFRKQQQAARRKRPAQLDAPGTTPMAPDPSTTQSTLTDAYNANNIITAYCQALANIQLNWVSGPSQPPTPPDWFTALQAALATAQTHATTWITSLGPQIFSTVPQSIINYSNTFTAATNDILNIINGLPQGTDPTAAQQQQINALIGAILSVLQTQSQSVTTVQTLLTTFQTNVQGDNTALVTGQNNAQNAVTIDQGTLQSIQAQINQVQQEIAADSKLAEESEIGLGVAIFIVVVGIALTVATAGAAAPILVGVGVVAVGLAIAGTVIFSQKVNSDIQQLYSLQSELSAEQAQVASLQGIVNSITALVQANEAAQTAISAVADAWSVLEAKLSAVQTQLNNAEAGDVLPIIESLDLQTAQTDWAQLTAFATNMQNNGITVQPPIQQPTGSGSPSAMASARRAQKAVAPKGRR
jgi:hypothetical protein